MPDRRQLPVLLPPAAWDDWLADTEDLTVISELLVPAPDDILTMYPVEPLVNNVRNNGPQLLNVDPSPLAAGE